MKKNPNPEVFAKTVLSELARLRGEVFATRLRLYHSLVHSGFPKSFAELSDEDDKNIDEPYEKFDPPGLIRAMNNLTVNCTGVQSFNDTVFTPPYFYTPDAAASVPGAVTNWAGAGKTGF